jgi:hypothetical protein
LTSRVPENIVFATARRRYLVPFVYETSAYGRKTGLFYFYPKPAGAIINGKTE